MKKITKINTSLPCIPKDFKLVSNTDLGKISVKDISLYLSEKQKNGTIRGEDLLKELQDKKPLGSAILKYLLENPQEIPKEWKGQYISFFGTIIEYLNGRRYVLSLCWDGSRWGWSDDWLGAGWDVSDPSVVLASKSSLPLESFNPTDFKIEYQGKKYVLKKLKNNMLANAKAYKQFEKIMKLKQKKIEKSSNLYCVANISHQKKKK